MSIRQILYQVRPLLIAAGLGAAFLALLFVFLGNTSWAAPDAPAGKSNVGDYVWLDSNVDGEHIGGGEAEFAGGINGVLVNLYLDVDFDGLIDAGEYVSSTVTGDDPSTPAVEKGWYNFDVTANGNQYLVEIAPSNFGPGGVLEGFTLTSAGTYGPNHMIVSLPAPIMDWREADFGFARSDLTVSKVLLTPLQGYTTISNTITYQIRITNTGVIPIVSVPLYDYFSPSCLGYQSASPAPNSVNLSTGVLHWVDLAAAGPNGFGQPLLPGGVFVVTVNFHAQKTGEMYWKEGGWEDYAPKGMPDFDQKQDSWDNPVASGQGWFFCGPVAAANSLWWFDSKFEPNPLPPPAINDNYPLVPLFGNWDDHDPRNVQPFVSQLAGFMGTTPGAGTNVVNLANGIQSYINSRGLAAQYTVSLQPKPTFEWVEDEVRRSEDVILLVGFWQEQTPGAPASARRVGGHYLTVAGIDALNNAIGFSDPYRNNAEAGGAGRVLPGPHAALHPTPGPISDTVHNDAKYISHDLYPYQPTQTPGGIWGPQNYVNPNPFVSCPQIQNFQGQNVPQEFQNLQATCAPTGGLIWAEVEYAVAVSPVTPTILCDPTNNIAVVIGAIDELGNVLPEKQDETEVHVVTPDIGIQKDLVTPVSGTTVVSNSVVFQVDVTNTGTTILATVPFTDTWNDACLALQSVSPDLGTGGGACVGGGACTRWWDNIGPLNPGQSKQVTFTFHARYNPIPTFPPTLPDCAPTTNTASASGVDVFGLPAGPVEDSADVNIYSPSIKVVKTAGNAADGATEYIVAPGGNVQYTYQVTNTGDTSLVNITVMDDNGTPGVPGDDFQVCVIAGPLAPGASSTCQATVAVSSNRTNIATATGTPSDPQGTPLPGVSPVTDTDDAVVDMVRPLILIEKTPDLQHVISGGVATFTIKVTNTGDTYLTNITVTDPLATNCGANIPMLAPTQSFSYNCTRNNVTADFTNVATVVGTPSDSQGTPLPDVPNVSDDDDAVVDVRRPALTITKILNTPEPVRTTDPLSFTIFITNTGDTILTVVPLTDTYDTNYLTYGYLGQYANPVSVDNLDDGQIDWSDLTVSFGQDLAPGSSFSVVVTFTALEDTSLLPNHETINTGIVNGAVPDPDGVGPLPPFDPMPPVQDEEPVEIKRPTAVRMVVSQPIFADAGVNLAWSTVTEVDVAGFRVWRQRGAGALRLVSDEVMFAEHSGADRGADYSFRDVSVKPGVYRYVIEVITLAGYSVRYEAGTVLVPIDDSGLER